MFTCKVTPSEIDAASILEQPSAAIPTNHYLGDPVPKRYAHLVQEGFGPYDFKTPLHSINRHSKQSRVLLFDYTPRTNTVIC